MATEADVERDLYPDLLQTGIQRLKAHISRYGYGLAETRPRADRYFLRFGTDEASLLVSISVDAAGWAICAIGRGVRYDSGELTSKAATIEELDDLLQQIDPPPAPGQPKLQKMQVIREDATDRMAYLGGAVKDRPPTVDDLLRERKAWPRARTLRG